MAFSRVKGLFIDNLYIRLSNPRVNIVSTKRVCFKYIGKLDQLILYDIYIDYAMTTYGRPDFNNDDLESSFRYYGEFHVRQPVSGWSKTEKERLANLAKNQISPKMLDWGAEYRRYSDFNDMHRIKVTVV